VLNALTTAQSDRPAGRFLGVRLTSEEEALLERFRRAREFSTRSDAVRALVRDAASEKPSAVELPATLGAELEELVEEGFASDPRAALEIAVSLGLQELERTHGERWDALQLAARARRERKERRRRADREGRGLLGR
jgi:Arc/MetJ-type ribon-helix-helix transcriptional regulator